MKSSVQKIAYIFLFALTAYTISAQNFHMVKDINSATDANPTGGSYLNTGTYSNNYSILSGISYFAASDGLHGTELWRSDGTAAGTYMVKDINNGANSSTPNDIVILKNELYFIANDGIHGIEIWKSDGTTNGTSLVKDINPGIGNASPSFLMSTNTNLYFFISNGSRTAQFWRSDGSDSGTILLKDFTDVTSYLLSPVQFKNEVYLFVPANTGLQLWKTNSQDSVLKVTDVAGEYTMFNAIADGKTLYFDGFDGNLWKSDGTAAGTLKVSSVAASYLNDFILINDQLLYTAIDNFGTNAIFKFDSSTSTNTHIFTTQGLLSNKIVIGNNLYFFSFESGGELWKDDLTTNETVIIKKFDSSYIPSNFLTAIGNNLYFSIYTKADGSELWKSDGTTNGTVQVKDIFPGIASSYPVEFTLLKNKIIFNADDGKHGKELWSIDTLTNKILLLKDINTSYTSASNPFDLSVYNNKLFFAAYNSAYGKELWSSDGTEQGTKLVKDISLGSLTGISVNNPQASFLNAGNNLYFVGSTAHYGNELWKTNGDSSSTVIVKDQSPGTAASNFYFNSISPYHYFANVNGRLYYVGDDSYNNGNSTLYSTNGSNGDILTIYTNTSAFKNLLPFQNKLVYNVGSQLLITDSSSSTNQLIATAHPDDRSSLFTYKDALYYGSTDGYMWSTDGTDAHNSIFKKIRPDPYYFSNYADISPEYNERNVSANAVLNGILYFAAFDLTHGSELWKTDGTSNGTVLIKDINNGTDDSQLGNFVVVGSILYFFADDGIHGRELWKTDGTSNGTVLVKDITVGSASSEILSVTQVQDKVVFLLYNGTDKSYTLWQSDGTTAGTKAVDNVALNNIQITPPLRVIDDKIYFAATSIQYGNELWVGTLNSVLAVQLLNFAGKLLSDNVQLNWSTVNEQNFNYFNLQRSIDGIHFSTIVKINAANNQNVRKDYQYVDDNILNLKSNHIYYRLEEIDKDGKLTLSTVVLIRLKEKGISITAQPNPVISDFKIQIDNAQSEQQAQVQIINSTGSIILNEKRNFTAGNNVLNYKASSWASGVYVAKVILADGTKKEIKIVKQ